MAVAGIHTYMTLIGMISISDDGDGKITGVYLPNGNLPPMTDLESPIIKRTAEQIEEYLLCKRKTFDIPLSIDGTEFQMKVWNAISKIPYGETRTYSQIAAMIGSPGSYRAVGTACGKNPVPLLIPCHRVIPNSGDTGGFAGGRDLKKRLLDMEIRE